MASLRDRVPGRSLWRVVWVLLALTASMIACSSLTGGGSGAGPEAEATVVPAGPTSDEQASNCPAPSEDNLLLAFPDVEEMTLLTPESGGGQRPLLDWDPVDGAATYGLTLYDSDGEPYWAWIGYEDQIYVGGVTEQPDAEAKGPIVHGCMTWMTTAYAEDGEPIAAGGPRSLSP